MKTPSGWKTTRKWTWVVHTVKKWRLADWSKLTKERQELQKWRKDQLIDQNECNRDYNKPNVQPNHRRIWSKEKRRQHSYTKKNCNSKWSPTITAERDKHCSPECPTKVTRRNNKPVERESWLVRHWKNDTCCPSSLKKQLLTISNRQCTLSHLLRFCTPRFRALCRQSTSMRLRVQTLLKEIDRK